MYRVVEFAQGQDGYLISKEGKESCPGDCFEISNLQWTHRPERPVANFVYSLGPVFMFVLDAVPLVLGIGIWVIIWPPVVLEKIAVQVRSQMKDDGQDGSWTPHNDDVPMVRA